MSEFEEPINPEEWEPREMLKYTFREVVAIREMLETDHKKMKEEIAYMKTQVSLVKTIGRIGGWFLGIVIGAWLFLQDIFN